MTSMEKDSGRHFRGAATVAVVITALLLIPPLYSMDKLGMQAVFNFLKADTFFYLSVANNSHAGFYTFDHELATNGFHPLWQFIVTDLFDLMEISDQVGQIKMVFFLSIVITILGYCLAGIAIYNITKSRLISILLVPGLFYVAFSFILRFAASPWQFMDGMESCLSLLFGGALLCLIAAHYNNPGEWTDRNSFYLIAGVLLAFIFMSRLDDVFLVISFCLCVLFLRDRPVSDNIRKVLILGFPSALFLICYTVYNLYSVGTMIPISGLVKSGFALGLNLQGLTNLLLPEPFPSEVRYHLIYLHNVYRHVLMWFPMLFAILFGLMIWRGAVYPEKTRAESVFLFSLLFYVCLKGLYNLVYVVVGHQGVAWYYTLSILVINSVALILCSRIYSIVQGRDKLVAGCATCVLVLFIIVHLTLAMKKPLYGANQLYAFWKDREVISSELKARKPGLKLVEFDDGIINYSLGIPTIHGMGFVLDYKGYLAWKKGKLLDYCLSRGFDTIASMQYVPIPRATMSSDEIESLYRRSYWFRRENLRAYRFKVLFIHKKTGASFVGFRRRHDHR